MSINHLKASLLFLVCFLCSQFVIADDCLEIYKLSSIAVQSKNSGATKEETQKLFDTNPSKSEYVQFEAGQILKEVYEFSPVDEKVYSVYKTELCVQMARGIIDSRSYNEMHPKLEMCSSKKDRKTKVECAMKVSQVK